MARLGHNHVIVNHALTGWIDFGGTTAPSTFSLTLPVGAFVVDDKEARRQEGPDFPGEIDQGDKAATERNMQSAAVLNAAQFATITVSGTGIANPEGTNSANLSISVAGHQSKITAPVALERDSRRLAATGTIELLQSAIGLTPFSVMLGALQVQDAMRLKFTIIAVAL